MQLKQDSTLRGGKYKIEKVLGQGGFGITYLALQNITIKGDIGEIETKIKVTIKEFFMKDLCNRERDTSHVSVGSVGSKELVEKFKAKFIKEAQNIAKLKHDNIIKVFDVFEENDTAYYVMEYVSGGSLSEHVAQCGALVEREAVHYIHQIADALRFVHEQRINHLDVKPSNILLKEGAVAVLIDFGLAKQYDSAGEQTSSTPVGVSKGYAPMEQYKAGGVSSFSPASDIYSLGATLYKLATGSTPPEAHDVFDSGLPELPTELSADIKKAITMAMQPSRNARPQSVAEFLEILGGEDNAEETAISYKPSVVIEPEPVKATPPKVATPEPEPEQRPIKPKQEKSKNGLIIGIMTALLVITGVFIYMNSQASASEAEEYFNLAKQYYDTEDYEEAVKWFSKAAEQEYAKAQLALGLCHIFGEGVSQSDTEAVKWFRKAAEQGDDEAQLALGACYADGTGVSQSNTEAVKWARKAAEQEYAKAQLFLGLCYEEGLGVSQSDTEAVKWFRKAAEQGDDDAQYNLGLCYELGDGVSQSDTEAVKWYKKAAKQGNQDAVDKLKELGKY